MRHHCYSPAAELHYFVASALMKSLKYVKMYADRRVLPL